VARVFTLGPRLSICCLALWAGLSVATWAQSPNTLDQTSEQIKALRAEISVIQARLASQESERDTLQDALQKAEVQIGELDRQLGALSQKRRALKQELTALDAEGEQLRDAQRQRANTIDVSIQELWVLQQGGGFRVWLGDQNPEDVARNLAYFEALIEAQQQTIAEYELGLEAVEQNRSRIAQAQTALREQATAAAATKATLTDQRATRQSTLTLISQRVQDDQQRLSALERDQARLNALLDELEALAAASSPVVTPPEAQLAFADTQGALSMPMAGKLTNRYGARRNADIRWRGWLITADEGEPVRAVHGGDIIYADWLRGQGLLIVIDHGEGWLSLYAQNHSLLRGVGDRVSAGDIIAKAGASGGSETSGLYFEIRHRGEPVDPGEWIRR
jgi:septal ring factor EnvC (AmiA/AmiB activator)